MEWLSIGSSVLSIVTLTILGWFVVSYFPNYLKEKSNSIEIEQIKSEILNENKLFEKKREVYEEIVSSLKIFISGHAATDEHKNEFHNACPKACLWVPDPVLAALNKFLDAQVLFVKRTGEIDQVTAKQLYENVVIAMRKDVGVFKNQGREISFCYIQLEC